MKERTKRERDIEMKRERERLFYLALLWRDAGKHAVTVWLHVIL